MVIYPNNYSNFRTIMEVIMKNKWLLCILLMLFLPFGLFAQVADCGIAVCMAADM